MTALGIQNYKSYAASGAYTDSKAQNTGYATKPSFYPRSIDSFAKSDDSQETYFSDIASDMDGVFSLQSDIANTERQLKEIGCTALKNVAATASGKGKGISRGLESAILGYEKEINSIIKDKSLSDSEKASKIKLVNAKKAASIKEAEAKMNAMLSIADTLTRIAPMFLKLKELGVNTEEFTRPIIELIQGINTASPSFKNAKSPQEVTQQSKLNMQNLFGKDSKKAFEKNISEFDKKERAAQEKLKDKSTSPKDKEAAQTEIKVLKEMKLMFAMVSKQSEF